MNLNMARVLLVLVVALITIPIFWLVIQANDSVPFLIPIIILGSGVFVYVISHKTRYKSPQQPYQHMGFSIRRVEKALASGAATMFVVGFITESFIRQLLPGHFWHIYLGILFVLGAIIEDTLQIILQKNDYNITAPDQPKIVMIMPSQS
ncbi:MAG: hypothetical protein FWB84_03200 [Candidatus Bathyarchaeota archaeon]|uniref:hypothetical protein n=1 Tax=Candidatus Bathycorpusculum sp. TaxID=2994959 RepID=UPI00283A4A1A|nr:hypothetical protein [Candidatus Termiticorpusculum sp.]MCL2257566.1 hypothetical protein [Candidatus Termiticorpusculum sp.]MCL2292299.1 hypothetical protein [Candidatus Termiticorpusculum sp.]